MIAKYKARGRGIVDYILIIAIVIVLVMLALVLIELSHPTIGHYTITITL